MSSTPNVVETPLLPSAILLVEDEPVLRSSIARGLGKLTNVEVMAAATVTEAVTLLDSRAPSLLISDIDLPGQSGLELVSEMRRRGINIPTIFVTAYLQSYRQKIPEHPNLVVLEKPIPINELRNRAKELLGPAGDSMRAPFSLIDYTQLACLGHRSVRIDVEYGYEAGQVIIHEGEIWSALDDQGSGPEAFARLAFVPNAMVSCFAMGGDPGTRNITTRWEQLILDSARAHDERERDRLDGVEKRTESAKAKTATGHPVSERKSSAVPPPLPPRLSGPPPVASPGARTTQPAVARSSVQKAVPAPVQRTVPAAKTADEPRASEPIRAVPTRNASRAVPAARSGGPAIPTEADKTQISRMAPFPSEQPTFEELWAAAADALLSRQFAVAARTFAAAERLRPGNPLVAANLHRLREMGFGREEGDEK